ncbi:alpha/beta hydrolase [Streptomyces sp. NPDC058611]|uniref:alpha/beta hydrolase n=1 Tax=unclassified Streptomyces TaxID=2593676 RepID=UPI0036651ED6
MPEQPPLARAAPSDNEVVSARAVLCADTNTWPTTTVNDEVSALILQNQWDPLTLLAGGRRMHRALRGSRMVTVAAGGGTASTAPTPART